MIKKFQQKILLNIFLIASFFWNGSIAYADNHHEKSYRYSHGVHHKKSSKHLKSYSYPPHAFPPHQGNHKKTIRNSVKHHSCHSKNLSKTHKKRISRKTSLHSDFIGKNTSSINTTDTNISATNTEVTNTSDTNIRDINIKNINIKDTNTHHKLDMQENTVPTSSVMSLPKPFETADTAYLTPLTLQTSEQTSESVISSRQKLVGLVNKVIDALHYTSYRFGGNYFDLSRGIYEEDCSGYVDQLLHHAEPLAFAALTQSSHSEKPSSFDYYDFFKRLPHTGWRFWRKIEDVANLNPGAILVFRYFGHSRFATGGHVMVVMSKPIPVENDANAFLVRVSDSAASGHSNDTRGRHASGVGIGTLLLRINPFTGKPSGFAWNLHSFEKNVQVAMAEPINPA